MTNQSQRSRVAVVGGGFSGLTAAYELVKAGHTVELFEAAPNVGGLAAGFSLADGFPLEKAYHFLYTTDNYMINMAKELGIRGQLNFYPSSIVAFYRGKAFPFTTSMDLLQFAPLSFVDRVRTGVTTLYLMMLRDWRSLNEVSEAKRPKVDTSTTSETMSKATIRL